MKTTRLLTLALAFACALLASAPAAANSLESFLDHVEATARVDLSSFKADLRVTFGVSDSKINGLFEVMSKPSDVYMCLRIGEISRQPLDRIVDEHRKHKGQGWGRIAQNLGIKPGSAEFHALKEGRLASHSGGASSGKKGRGKGKK
jgi:hypothetical protein